MVNRNRLTKKEKADKKLKKEQKRAKTRKNLYDALARTLITTTKQLIWWFTINGTIWIYCSYILAFMQRDQIAESLSSNVCTVIIGSLVMYVISKTVENAFKYNELGGKSNPDALRKDGIYYEQPVESVEADPEPEPEDGAECFVNPADLS